MSAGRVTWFGVRHHSPAAARLLSSLMAERPFAAVLVEGPSDFTPRIAELGLDHRPPIAVYSSAIVDGERHAAYHPFCAHSPEWIAVRAGLAAGADVRFVDLPWGVLAGLEETVPENRYADGPLTHVPQLAALCARLGVDDFDGAWDLLVEADPALTLDTYMSRVAALAAELRGEDPALVPREDRRREAFMAAEVRRALSGVDGDVLVVCGAFHVPGLRALVEEGAAPSADDVVAVPEAVGGDGRTLALTPYDDERLDALAGYDAGLPSPGFYAHAWAARGTGGDDDAAAGTAFDRALAQVVAGLRRAGQPIAPADLIAVRTTAGALARLRGHAEPWRRDLLDGVLGALVKDEVVLGVGHPVLDATRRVLRGDGRGRLADAAPRPPLVVDVAAALARLDLEPRAQRRAVALDLTAPEALERSRVLHACRILDLPGFALDDRAADDDVLPSEAWELRRATGFEGQLIEACAYGASLGEAVGARLLEAAGRPDAAHADGAAALLEDALRAGMAQLTAPLAGRLATSVAQEADARRLARSVARLTHLHRFEPVLGSAGRADVGALLAAALRRALWRLDPGGGAVPAEDPGTELVVAAVGAHERAGAALGFDDDEVADVLGRLARSAAHPAGMRGAALGALWTLDVAGADELVAAVDAFGDPDVLGDFLHGVFGVARDVVRRRPEVQAALDGVVAGYDDDAFLMALPGLRRAFSAFAPREKDALARALVGEARVAPLADPAEADALAAVEARVGALARELGVRGG